MNRNSLLDAMICVLILLVVFENSFSQIGATQLCDDCQGEECTECLNDADSTIQKRSCKDCRQKWQAYCVSCFIPGKRALELPETGYYEDKRRESGSETFLEALQDNILDKIFENRNNAEHKTSSQNFQFDYPKTKNYGSETCELDSVVRRLPQEWREELVDLIMLVSSTFSE